MDLSGLDGVLFDMDGTLVDSDAAVERAWRGWAADNGLDRDEVLAYAQGVPAASTVRRFRPELSDEQARRHVVAQLDRERADLDDVAPAPGAHRALAAVRELGLRWAVVTSADRALASARLGHCAIRPPVLVTVDDVTRGKPDPQGYLIAADRLALEPSRCLVVEDSDAGVAAGRAAGARVASVRGRAADLLLTDLGQLADLLERDRRASGRSVSGARHPVSESTGSAEE